MDWKVASVYLNRFYTEKHSGIYNLITLYKTFVKLYPDNDSMKETLDELIGFSGEINELDS